MVGVICDDDSREPLPELPAPITGLDWRDGQPVSITGRLVSIHRETNRVGSQLAGAILVSDDGRQLVRVLVWPHVYARYGQLVCEGDAVTVTGRADRHRGHTDLIATQLSSAAVTP